jgi:hypothetical protein
VRPERTGIYNQKMPHERAGSNDFRTIFAAWISGRTTRQIRQQTDRTPMRASERSVRSTCSSCSPNGARRRRKPVGCDRSSSSLHA